MRKLAVVHNPDNRNRTDDIWFWRPSLYQLSYTPVGCLLLTSFTLSALGYADYTKYRLLNLFLFALQICGYLRFVISLRSTSTAFRIFNIYRDMLLNRVQGSNLLVPTDHGIKTPPDKKGEKSGGVPNVWKDFEVFLLTPCYTIYYLKRTMWTKRTNFYFSFIHL